MKVTPCGLAPEDGFHGAENSYHCIDSELDRFARPQIRKTELWVRGIRWRLLRSCWVQMSMLLMVESAVHTLARACNAL